MRISDWSSDVCSSDLGLARHTQEIDFPGYLYSCDLTNAGETEDMLRVIREKYPVDAIVNNVGVVMHEPLGEVGLSPLRSAERRVGTECVSTFRPRRSQEH